MHDLRTIVSTDRHTVHEALIIETGTYCCQVEDQHLTASAGQVVVHPAGTSHRPLLPADGTVRFLVIQWSGPCPFGAGTVIVDPARRAILVGQWLLDLFSLADGSGKAVGVHLLTTFLCELERLAHGGDAGHDPITRARNWLLANLAYPLRREDLCRICQLSPSRLNERFLAATGLPPMHWLRRLRAQHAWSLLTTTDWSAERVAIACGLGTAAHLSRVMRQDLGITPRSARRGTPPDQSSGAVPSGD